MKLTKEQTKALNFVNEKVDTNFIGDDRKLVVYPKTIRSLVEKGLIRYCDRKMAEGTGYCLTAKGYLAVN